MKARSTGFTLIELVVVLVLLAILAAVAIPKYIDIQDEARFAALEAEFAAFASATKLYHSGWLSGGHTGAVENLSTFGDGTVDSTETGWPFATTNAHMWDGCQELWHGLTESELSVEGVDSGNPITGITSDIGVTYTNNPNTCIYIGSHFIQKQQDTLQMIYDIDSGEVTINKAGYGSLDL